MTTGLAPRGALALWILATVTRAAADGAVAAAPTATAGVDPPAVAAPPPPRGAGEFARRGVVPDLTVGGGVVVASDGDARRWMARARAGAMFYAEPALLAIGVSAQLTALRSTALGVEAEYVDLWRGVWLEGGVWPIDSRRGVIATAAAGYALFGLQLERRLGAARAGDLALTIVVHLPLGALAVAR